jgi:hypothetical protein
MAKGNMLAEIDVAVAAAMAERRLTWFDRLPTEAMDTLLAAREKFHAGGYGTTKRLTLARILIEYCETRGWRSCDHKRMGEWLAKRN